MSRATRNALVLSALAVAVGGCNRDDSAGYCDNSGCYGRRRGIARRIEQISGDRLELNYGTLYPALLKLEQEGSISSEWGVSENNRRAKYYRLTRTGRKQIKKETQEWRETTAILARFLAPAKGRL